MKKLYIKPIMTDEIEFSDEILTGSDVEIDGEGILDDAEENIILE